MLNKVRYKNFDQIDFTDVLVFSKLPAHPFWSRVQEEIDFSFADRLCAVLYSGRGQRPYAPSLKLKVHLVQAYYCLSDRQVEEKIIGDLFVKRFLELPVDFIGFDHSTIGLDRNRMGETMFRACHLYILAQLYNKGIWGDHNEQWIIDSFPTNISMSRHGAFRLIKQAMLRVVNHLKRFAPTSIREAAGQLPLDALTAKLTKKSTTEERMLAFSHLVAQAYGLLHWFENENVTPQLSEWKSYAKSQELQEVLRCVLEENSRPYESDEEPTTSSNEESSASNPESQPLLYEKIPRKERPTDRVEDVIDPEARTGKKNKSTIIKGYKTQNLCTTSGVILDTKVIPANEHDRSAMSGMIQSIQDFFRHSPQMLLADSVYGYGQQRQELAMQGISLVAPVAKPTNPTNLFSNTSFTYASDIDAYLCPGGKQSIKKRNQPKLEGAQYYFDSSDCNACSLQTECTTSQNGRTVFRSHYADIYEKANKFNDSLEGISLLQERYTVERKNNELKNHCKLNKMKVKGRETIQIKALLATIAVNLKHTIREKFKPMHGFLRRAKMA